MTLIHDFFLSNSLHSNFALMFVKCKGNVIYGLDLHPVLIPVPKCLVKRRVCCKVFVSLNVLRVTVQRRSLKQTGTMK